MALFVSLTTINRASCYRLQGWMGPNYSISTACATSNFCILSAANHIIRGEAVSYRPTKSVNYVDVVLLSNSVNICAVKDTIYFSTMFLGSSI